MNYSLSSTWRAIIKAAKWLLWLWRAKKKIPYGVEQETVLDDSETHTIYCSVIYKERRARPRPEVKESE